MLLILAGVALNSIFGQGSLIGNAQNAVDEYNKKVEEERLALEQIEEYFKNNGVTQTATLQLVDKGEDFIKVKVDGENYEEFEFSIDNGEYVSSDLPEYTFNNLEITTVTGMDTLVEEGTMHTIKAKAKNKKTGEIEEVNSIQVATDVLVESDQVQYFKYEDNGEGIIITELVPFSELITDKNNRNDWNNFFDNLQETIVVPSYIDDKPVIKITNNFIKQVANIDTYKAPQAVYLMGWAGDKTYINGDAPISDFQVEEDGSIWVYTGLFVPEDKAELICVLENQIGLGETQKTTNPINITLEIQNGIVKNGNVNLILPPTLQEIIDNKISKIGNRLMTADKMNYTEQDIRIDLPGLDLPIPLSILLSQENNNTNINNTTIYMLGQTNQEKEILKEQIGINWNTFTQVKVQE